MNDEQFKKLMMDPNNLKAAHHKPCDTCTALAADRGFGPIRCNPLRGALSLERVRRIINKRTGQHLDEGAAKPSSEPEGREFLWDSTQSARRRPRLAGALLTRTTSPRRAWVTG